MNPGLSLPIINITPYLLRDSTADTVSRRAQVSSSIHAACRDYGFFYLDISAIVDAREPEELTELAREFFLGCTQEEKNALALSNQDGARGYARLNENKTNGKTDNHEGIDFYRPVPNPDKSKPLWGENQWPMKPPMFKEKYEAWVEKMKMLGMIVMEAMAVGLGMTPDEWKQLRSKVDDSFWVMRAIGYPPLPNDHDGFSCGAHKDYGCLTLLYADPTRDALQVFLRRPALSRSSSQAQAGLDLPAEEGGEEGVWISADPVLGCVVCNIGEMWEIWSNGLYKSTLHRVVHRGSNYRVSIPFFFEPNFEALVKPLDAALRTQAKESSESQSDNDTTTVKSDGKEKKYKPTVYGEFLMRKVGNNFVIASGKEKLDN